LAQELMAAQLQQRSTSLAGRSGIGVPLGVLAALAMVDPAVAAARARRPVHVQHRACR
jgi:hypothetical protein